MPERVTFYLPGDRFGTLAKSGAAVVWEVNDNGTFTVATPPPAAEHADPEDVIHARSEHDAVTAWCAEDAEGRLTDAHEDVTCRACLGSLASYGPEATDDDPTPYFVLAKWDYLTDLGTMERGWVARSDARDDFTWALHLVETHRSSYPGDRWQVGVVHSTERGAPVVAIWEVDTAPRYQPVTTATVPSTGPSSAPTNDGA